MSALNLTGGCAHVFCQSQGGWGLFAPERGTMTPVSSMVQYEPGVHESWLAPCRLSGLGDFPSIHVKEGLVTTKPWAPTPWQAPLAIHEPSSLGSVFLLAGNRHTRARRPNLALCLVLVAC